MNMGTDWDMLSPAPYYDLYIGFYLVEHVHFEVVGDGYDVHFGVENGVLEDEYADIDMYDFWNDVEPPGLVNGFKRMCG